MQHPIDNIYFPLIAVILSITLAEVHLLLSIIAVIFSIIYIGVKIYKELNG